MSERDRLYRDLIEAEAIHANLLARVGPLTNHPAFTRWLTESEHHVTKLRERVAKLEATP